jgi:hypothetical protein
VLGRESLRCYLGGRGVVHLSRGAQGADFQFSCGVSRCFAHPNLKSCSGAGFQRIRNQQVSGSSPLADFH